MSTLHAPTLPQAAPLAGRTALVTGGGRGLGAAIARRLASAGARLVLVGRTAETLDAVAAELPGDPVVITADLADGDEPARVVEAAVAATGRLDVLVNNAGRSYDGGTLDATATDVDDLLALNLRAPLLLSTAAAPVMARQGGGSIVSISSALARQGVPATALYAATKGAIEAATRSLATELGPSGIRVNAIRPAITRSDMAAGIVGSEDKLGIYLPHVPLGDVGEPEDIAAAALFLVSDEAAYVTGQILDVDGGWGISKPALFDRG